jgi:hypothetical protein
MKFNYAMELLSFYSIFLLVLLPSSLRTFAQDDNDSTTSSGSQLSPETIGSIIGHSTVVSGGVTTVIDLARDTVQGGK